MPLPQPDPDRPETLRPRRVAELRALGATRSDLRGRLFRVPHRGVRTWAALQDPGPGLRILEAAVLLPTAGAVAGWAAAYLLGADEFDGLDFTRHGLRQLPVELHLPKPVKIRHRAGVRVIRGTMPAEDQVRVDGIPVTNGLRTAFDLARRSTPTDAVVALDVLAHRGIVDLGELSVMVRARSRWPGVAKARRALLLAHPGAESPGETRVRLAARAAGLPRLLVQPNVTDRAGRFVARPDLLDEAAGLVFEYDGAGHREPRQQDRDRRRRHRLESVGLVVREIVAADMGPGLGAWLVSQHEQALALPRPRLWIATPHAVDPR